MEQRISMVTLGVADLATSRDFYEKLGWQSSPASQLEIVFFQAGGIVIALFPTEALAADAQLPNAPIDSFGGIALAHNLPSPAEVDRVMEEARAAGAAILKPAQKTFWGGYAGYFADPDGHLWEAAHNPFWELTPDGRVLLPGRET